MNQPTKRLILPIIILLAAITLGVITYKTKNNADPAATPATTNSPDARFLTSKDSTVCGQATLSVLLCEDVASHKITKFAIPHELESVNKIIPSPDGKLLLASSFPVGVNNQSSGQKFYILNDQLQIVKRLPDQKSGEDGFGFTWSNDSKSLVYDKRQLNDNKEYGLSQLYTYDLQAGRAKVLTNAPDGANDPQVYKDGTILARSQTTDSSKKPERLLAVSPTDGSIREIDSSIKDFASFVYNHSTGLLYGTSINPDSNSNRYPTVIARLQDNNGKLSLERLKSYSYERSDPKVITSKGLLLYSNKIGETAYTLTADGSDNSQMNQTKLALTSDQVNSLFALPQPLAAKAAANSTLTAADYLYEPTTPPARLHEFLAKHVSEGCQVGQYRNVVLYAFDTDTQAAVSEGQCANSGTSAMAYYKYDGSTYQKLTATQEGVDCDRAASLGISKVVLPVCSDGSY